jgi:hypothetical protein
MNATVIAPGHIVGRLRYAPDGHTTDTVTLHPDPDSHTTTIRIHTDRTIRDRVTGQRRPDTWTHHSDPVHDDPAVSANILLVEVVTAFVTRAVHETFEQLRWDDGTAVVEPHDRTQLNLTATITRRLVEHLDLRGLLNGPATEPGHGPHHDDDQPEEEPGHGPHHDDDDQPF